jgi:Sec-independent protein secretion pathway component TatC
MLAVPICLLYELGILSARTLTRRTAASASAENAKD